jgi:hypothetical protein
MEEIVHIVERAVDLSRARLMRDLRKIWPQRGAIVAMTGEMSRASFGVQACDSTGESGARMDGCHA